MAQFHVDPHSSDAVTLRRLISAAQQLSNEYHVWHSIPVRSSKHKIDLAILHPRFGLWLLNIVNWKNEQISHVDREYCTVRLLNKEGQLPNPLTLARQLHGIIKRALVTKAELIHTDGKFSGSLIFPVHHIVVFSAITNRELAEREYDGFFPAVQRITADELADIEASKRTADLLLQKRSPRIVNYNGLVKSQIEAIHRVLFPQMPPFQAIEAVSIKTEEAAIPVSKPTVTTPIAADKKQPEVTAKAEREVETPIPGELPAPESDEPEIKTEAAPAVDPDQLSDYEKKLLAQSKEQREVFVYNQVREVKQPDLQKAEKKEPQSDVERRPIVRSLDKLVKNNRFLLKYIWSRKQ
jgi:hypothetical protein